MDKVECITINHAEIKNFTIFEDIDITFDNVNIFIGENATGKTHLLKLLYALTRYGNIGSMLYMFGHPNIRRNDSMDVVVNLNNGDVKFTIRQIMPLRWEKEPYARCLQPYDNCLFIPAKDMLTHAEAIDWLDREYNNKGYFDKTFVDVVHKAKNPEPDCIPDMAKRVAPKLEKILNGRVVIEKDIFYVLHNDNVKTPFSLEAEGLKKIGLLWKLLMNGSLKEGTILFWDEPEANINPKLVPVLVDVILELSMHGVQIFIATHDYIFAKYVEVKMEEKHKVLFHSLYHTENGVKCETESSFSFLENNSILEESVNLYEEQVKKVLG